MDTVHTSLLLIIATPFRGCEEIARTIRNYSPKRLKHVLTEGNSSVYAKQLVLFIKIFSLCLKKLLKTICYSYRTVISMMVTAPRMMQAVT
jgi:hypothetical protein